MSDTEFIKLARNADSYSDICRKLNVQPNGGNVNTIKRRLRELNINTDNLCHSFPQKRLYETRHHIYSDSELVANVFCKHSYAKTKTLKKYMIDKYHISYVCAICGQQAIWNCKKLVLQVDHINGIHSDCRIENLRFLCPNCHSQTATWSGKNMGKHWFEPSIPNL